MHVMKSKAGLGNITFDMDAHTAYRRDFSAWKDSDKFLTDTYRPTKTQIRQTCVYIATSAARSLYLDT